MGMKIVLFDQRGVEIEVWETENERDRWIFDAISQHHVDGATVLNREYRCFSISER